MDRQTILDMLFGAVDQVNETLPPEDRLEKAERTALLGEGGKLDSLALVDLLLGAEELVNAQAKEPVSFAALIASDGDAPLPQTLGELADRIAALVGDR